MEVIAAECVASASIYDAVYVQHKHKVSWDKRYFLGFVFDKAIGRKQSKSRMDTGMMPTLWTQQSSFLQAKDILFITSLGVSHPLSWVHMHEMAFLKAHFNT